MTVDLSTVSKAIVLKYASYLWFDQYQIYKQHHVVMLDVFITESPAFLADCKAHSLAAGAVIGAGVFGVEGVDWSATFYADGHLTDREIPVLQKL